MSDDFDPNDLFDDFDDFDDDFSDDFGDFDNELDDGNDFGDDFDDGDDFGFGEDDLFDDNLLGDEFDDNLDDFDDDGFDDEDDFAEEEAEGGNFRNILIGMGALLVLGLIVIVALFAFNNVTDNSMEQTRVAIENHNATVQAQTFASSTAAMLGQTETLQAQLAGTQTAQAEQRGTEQAEIQATATGAVLVQTQTQEAIQQATDDFIAEQTKIALDEEEAAIEGVTQTAEAIQATLNPQGREPLIFEGQPVQTADGSPVILIDGSPFIIVNNQPVPVAPGSQLQTADGTAVTINEDGTASESGGGEQPMPTMSTQGVPLAAVEMTATALAELFNATPTQADIAPTTDLGSGGGLATTAPDDPDATPVPVDIGQGGGELPDTGLFDDVFGGNPMLIVLLAFGLFGVIVISRGVRSTNKQQ